MKTDQKLLLCTALLIFALKTSMATEPNKSIHIEDAPFELTAYPTTSADVNLKLMNLQFDPLGFIFWGPQLNLDFQIADVIAVGPYVRWNYAGVIYQGIVTDWFSSETTVSAASYGIGISGKVLPPIGSGKHRPYIDVGFEKFKGKDSYDPDGLFGRHYYEYKANVFHVGAGYRMITEGSFNLSIGILILILKETENFDYYEFESTLDHNPLEPTHLGATLQLALGWQFGGN